LSVFIEGRLIFGEKRKQHASPARHRSSTRLGDSTVDLSAPANSTVNRSSTTMKTGLDLHDWTIWRTQLNEQMATMMIERRADLRSLQQYLQSNAFYLKNRRDPSAGRHIDFRLLFSIPRAKFPADYLNRVHDTAMATIHHESTDIVNPMSIVSPMKTDQVIDTSHFNELSSKVGDCLSIDEQPMGNGMMRTR
jgi:hypothetical protein